MRNDDIRQLVAQAGFEAGSTPAELAKADQDFGGIRRGRAAAVARPSRAEEVAEVVQWSRRNGVSITPRGGGLSQSGQSLSPGGLVVQTDRLGGVQPPNSEGATVRCGPAATWRAVVSATAPLGMMPPVMPLNLDITVGGTMSAGGIGSSVHASGPAINHVEELTVVTGTGEVLTVSRERDPEVLFGVLGGAGRFGIVTSVTLRLRRARPRLRVFYLLYDDIHRFLRDQLLVAERGCQHVEGFCSAAVQGARRVPSGSREVFAHWFYGLQFAAEYDEGAPPDDEELLAGLEPYRRIHVEDDDLIAHAGRYDFRFAAMRRTGAWEHSHPWLEAFVPADAVAELVPDVLADQPMFLGDGHRLLHLADGPSEGFFMAPRPAIAFAILPMGVAPAVQEPALRWLAALDEKIASLGGKRYLSGYVGDVSRARWASHFGEKFEAWQELGRRLDPDGVFRSAMFADVS